MPQSSYIQSTGKEASPQLHFPDVIEFIPFDTCEDLWILEPMPTTIVKRWLQNHWCTKKRHVEAPNSNDTNVSGFPLTMIGSF